MASVGPVTVTEHESPTGTVPQASVVLTKARLDGRVSLRTAVPAPVPVFLTLTV